MPTCSTALQPFKKRKFIEIRQDKGKVVVDDQNACKKQKLSTSDIKNMEESLVPHKKQHDTKKHLKPAEQAKKSCEAIFYELDFDLLTQIHIIVNILYMLGPNMPRLDLCQPFTRYV